MTHICGSSSSLFPGLAKSVRRSCWGLTDVLLRSWRCLVFIWWHRMTSDGSTHFSYLLFCALGAITAWTCSLQCWTPVKAVSEVVQRASLPDTASFLFPYGSRQPSILVLVCLIMLFKRRFGKSVNRRNQIGNGTTHTETYIYRYM